MQTMCEKLRRRAMAQPDDVCYTYLRDLDEPENLDCRQLDRAATDIARELSSLAAPTDRVLLLLPSGLEFVQAFWACLYAGMIAVPLYPPKANDKSGKIKHIIADCRPTLAIVQDAPTAELIRDLGAGDVRFLTFNSIGRAAPLDLELPARDANSIAFLQYSSGSTGDPKGGMISHRNILANLAVLEAETLSCADDVFVGWLPLFHDMGMVMSILMPMYVGARSILFSPLKFAKHPLFWMQVMSRYRGTISGGPNFAYDTCAKRYSAAKLGDVDLSRWRLALNGAEPVRAQTLTDFCGTYASSGFKQTAFMPAYGMAEATVFLCGGALLAAPRILTADRDRLQSGVFVPADGASAAPINVVSCGSAPAGHELIVVDGAQVLAEGRVGEIWARGASIASGYWGKPDDAQAVFQAFTSDGDGPYLRTGDLGFVADGELFVLGRIKDVIIVQGRNIHPQDIEACVRSALSANAMADVVAFGIDDAATEKLVVLLEVRPRAMEASYEGIAAGLRASVFASCGVLIAEIAFARVGSIMKTTSGKVMRHAMRDRYAEQLIDALHVSVLDVSSGEYAPLSTETELQLARLWEEVLGATHVHANSNFLELGGDSLTIARLLANIRSQWCVDLPLQRVFEEPILSTLAALIDQAAGRSDVARIGGSSRQNEFAPLSFQQQRLWFLAQMGDDVGANENISVALRLKGSVDVPMLNRALAAIVERHETLRTRFVLDASDQPAQAVAPAGTFELWLQDLRSEGAIDAALQACIREEVARRFDLTRDLLLRASLVRVAMDEYVLLLSIHHIAADGWSLQIFVSELSALYRAYAEGAESSLPPLKVRYRDYACWQREREQSDRFAADAQYWRRQLTGLPAVHSLPLDHPRKSSKGFVGATLRTSIDASTTAGLRKLCAENAATLFMGLHAAFSALLSRYSNEQSIAIGTVVANREQSELHELIGLFANTVVLRSELSGDLTFTDALRHSRQSALDAYEHQTFPFEKIVQMLHPERSLDMTPLFQVLLLLQPDELPTLDLASLEIAAVEELDTFAKFDLTLSMKESQQGLQLTWKYDASLFDAATIARMAGSFSILIAGIVRSPTSQVAVLPLLSEDDRQHLLYTLNATQATFPHDKCIHELFEEQVEKTPDNTAVVYEDRQLTYAELNSRANQLAHYLREAGVKAETLVGLCVERSLEMVVGLLGILKAGAAYVPLDPGYPRDRLAYMIEDGGVECLLTQEALLGKATSRRVLSLDGVELQSTLQHYSTTNPSRLADQSSRTLAYVIYTSGSTGQPKGAMNEHRAVVNRLYWMLQCHPLSAQDRVLQKTPFSFDVSVWEFFWTLLGGAQLIMARPEGHKDPAYLSQLIRRRGVTRIHFVPSMLQAFLEQYRAGDCPSLQQIVCSGEELTAGLLRKCFERLPQVRVSNLYGPTEAAIEVTAWDCGAQDTIDRVPIGRPIANLRIYILDAHNQPVPLGVTAEICIAGVGVGRGYLNRTELTAERFVRDPFSAAQERIYRTGDLGRWRADGVIEYLGRNDHQVKMRGFRIEVGEIESQLMQHEHVAAAVVHAIEGASGQKRLVAYVTSKKGAIDSKQAQISALKARLERALPEYMVPAAFVVLDEMPLTASGKIDRKALPAPEAGLLGIEYVAPRTQTERTLVEICAGLLQLKPEEISTNASFFALGGHSLLVMQLVSSLRQAGLVTDVKTIYGAGSLRSLAASLDDGVSTGHRSFVAPGNLIPPGCERIEPHMLPLVSLSEAEIERIVATVPGGAANVQDIYPLAPLQEGILFSHLMHRDNDPYVLQALFSVPNRTRLDALILALERVIDRHDVLRTAVVSEDVSTPVQVVYRHAELSIETIELDPARDAVSQMKAAFDEPQVMDIARAPMLRLRVARDPQSERWLLRLQLHHIVSDHVGLDVIRSELAVFLSGAEPMVTPVPYREFVAHALYQARRSDADAERFFSQMLGDVTEPTAPFNLLDVHGDGTQIVEARKSVDPALALRVRQTARQRQISPAILFHAAWGLVVAACSGRNDVVFGTVLSGRLQGTSGVQHTLGMFINTLPLRVRLEGVSVAQLVEQVGAALRDLLAYEQVPLSTAQKCSGLAVNASLFSALLNYRHSQDVAQPLVDDAGIMLIQAQERTNYPFTASIDDIGARNPIGTASSDASGLATAESGVPAGGFSIDVQVDRSVDPDRVIGYLEAALAGIVEALQEQPDVHALSVSVLPTAERQQLLRDWNATQAVFPQDQCIHELFEAQVAKTPHHTAVVFEHEQLTYAELNARANQLAHYLRDAGVKPDTLVGLCVERSLEMLVGLIGILKAGGAYVPLDPAYPRDRLVYMVEDSGVEWLLTQESLRDTVAGRRVLCLDGTELQHCSTSNLTPHADRSPHNLAYVIYTSGSTGQPKGVMIEHHNVTRLFAASAQKFDFNAQDVWTLFHSFAFDFSVWEIWGALLHGGRLVVVPQWITLSPADFHALLVKEHVTVLNQTPRAFEQLIAADADSNASLSLRYVIFGGEALNVARLQAWIDRHGDAAPQLINMYGITETTVHVTYRRLLSADIYSRDNPSVIGHVLSDLSAVVLSPQRSLAPIGTAGELYVGGAGLARGYLNRPELTADRFISNPFHDPNDPKSSERLYKTGDLVRYLPDGNLEYLGRIDDQVKIRGFRIELGEIESALRAHPQVREAVVLAREDVPGQKRLVAYVSGPKESAIPNVEHLRTALLTQLPEYMVPALFVTLDEFPLTRNGKIDKKSLPPPEAGLPELEYVPPQTSTERTLVEICARLLQLKPEGISTTANFFALGGHSLLLVQFMMSLKATFNVELGMREMFSHANVRSIAASIDALKRKNQLTLELLSLPDHELEQVEF